MEETEKRARAEAMGLLARSAPGRLAELAPDPPPGFAFLRRPEIGAVMVRGRAGGAGAPFNLGEMTVTRCSVALECGAEGHAWTPGRDRDHALRAALIDALLQTDARPRIEREVLAPLRREEAARARAEAGRAEATRVDFFTLVRGENE